MLPRGTCGRFSESESLLDLIDCFVFGEMDPLLPLIPPELESSSSDPLNPPYLPLPPPLQTPATPATQSLLPSSHSSNNSASSQWHGNTSGLLGAISAWMMEARGSTSYLCALLSSLTCRPGSCAPSSPAPGPSGIRTRRAPSDSRLHLGRISHHLHHRPGDRPLLSGPTPLRLWLAPSYLRLRLCPRSLQPHL